MISSVFWFCFMGNGGGGVSCDSIVFVRVPFGDPAALKVISSRELRRVLHT